MKNALLILITAASVCSAEENILETIEKRWERPGFFSPIRDNPEMKKAVDNLKDFPRPWTVPRLIAWHNDPKHKVHRIDFLRLLAMSQDERGKLLFERYVERIALDDVPRQEIAFVYGNVLGLIMAYYDTSFTGGGTEAQAAAAIEWLNKRKAARVIE